jgi:hypothetical protein
MVLHFLMGHQDGDISGQRIGRRFANAFRGRRHVQIHPVGRRMHSVGDNVNRVAGIAAANYPAACTANS